MKKLGKELNLYRTGSRIFGKYRGYQIQVFDGNNMKVLILRIHQYPENLQQEIQNLKHQYKFRKAEYDGTCLTFTFRELIRPYSVRKIHRLLDNLVGILDTSSLDLTHRNCYDCGAEEHEFLAFNDIPLVLCSSCHEKLKHLIEEDREKYKAAPGNYLRGIAGGLGLAMVGIIPQVLLFNIVKVLGALSSALYVFLISKAFTRLKVKASPLSAALLTAMSLFMTVLGTVVAYVVFIFIQVRDIGRTVEVLGIPKIQNEMILNILLQLVFSSIYLVGIYVSFHKQFTFKNIEYAGRLS